MPFIFLKLLQYAVLILVMLLLIRSVRAKARSSGVSRIVEYGRPVKIFVSAIMLLVVFMTRGVLSDDPKATVTDWRIPAFLWLVFIPYLWEIFRRRLIFTENNFTVISPWGRRKRVEWSEVISIKYSAWLQWHVIKTSENGNVYLSDLLSGKAELLVLAEAAICSSGLQSGRVKFHPATGDEELHGERS